jgi:hypothetical protein
MRNNSRADTIAFVLSTLVTLAAAPFVAWWYHLGWKVMMKPFALPLFIAMFAGAVGMPAYFILRYIRNRKSPRAW